MLNSPLMENVRGLEQALTYVQKNGVLPLMLVGCILDPTGPKPVVLDVSPMDYDEPVRIATMNAVLLMVASKINGAK